MNQSSLFWPNQDVIIPFPWVTGWPDEPNNSITSFLFVSRLALTSGRLYWAMVCHYAPQFNSLWVTGALGDCVHVWKHQWGCFQWFQVISDKIYWFTYFFLLIYFCILLLFCMQKRCKKRNKEKLTKIKTYFHFIALFWDFLYVFLYCFFKFKTYLYFFLYSKIFICIFNFILFVSWL